MASLPVPTLHLCMQARMDPNVYVRQWATGGLMGACTTRPGYCCYAMWCPWCASYELRKQ